MVDEEGIWPFKRCHLPTRHRVVHRSSFIAVTLERPFALKRLWYSIEFSTVIMAKMKERSSGVSSANLACTSERTWYSSFVSECLHCSCDVNARCVQKDADFTAAPYDCVCNEGFIGNGRECVAGEGDSISILTCETFQSMQMAI